MKKTLLAAALCVGFAGVALPVGRGISVEAGYSGQYVSRPAPEDRMNHIASLSLMIRR